MHHPRIISEITKISKLNISLSASGVAICYSAGCAVHNGPGGHRAPGCHWSPASERNTA